MDDGLSSNPRSRSVEGSTSTTYPMQGADIDNKSAQSDGEERTNTSHMPSDDASGRENNKEGEDGEEVLLKRKRPKTSKVWEDLVEVTLPDGTKKAECVHCKTRLSIAGTGTTSTFQRHLSKCKKRMEYIRNQQLLNFQPIRTDGESPYESEPPLTGPPGKYDANKMRESIANWVMGTEQPFSVVEEELYVRMMKTATPFFEKSSRITTKTDCFKIYEHERMKLKALTKAASKISLTTDCWKSTHQKIEYMVITGHFIDQNWRLQKRVLSFVHVPPPRTGLDIADGIYKCLKEWEIEDKIFTISVDNAAYNDRAIRTLKENFSTVKKLVCGGRLFHIRCCAHILNLLVKDGLSQIQHVIEDVREWIKYINHSEARRQVFSNVAHQLQIRDRKFLIDVPTRWNSTYDMLSIDINFKDAFRRYKDYEPLFCHTPTEQDWTNVKNVCEILKVFKVCTNIISGSDYPTSNLYLIEVFRVKQTLDKASLSRDVFIRDMVSKMMAMDVLAIPISTVASESTFSAGGRVIDAYRSSLMPDTVQMLICGGDWIRHLHGVKKKPKKEEVPITRSKNKLIEDLKDWR